MTIITDDPGCAELFLTAENISWEKGRLPEITGLMPLVTRIFGDSRLFSSPYRADSEWSFLLISRSASESQYDILIDLCRENIPVPHGTICLAGEGRKFHGFKGRNWDSPPGNIYLSAHFAPKTGIEKYGPGFMVLSAVSVIDAIDGIAGMDKRAGIKWVNDIFIDNAKICGVLAHTLAENDIVTNAVIGVGLNVETTPNTKPTIFVPRAASLSDFVSGHNQPTKRLVFELLSKSIRKNYLMMISGGYQKLLDKYRERSIIIGREVEIYEDKAEPEMKLLADGIANKIDGNLGLYIDGISTPFNRGRLALKK